MNKQIVIKFLKGALTGGLSAVGLALSVGIKISTLDDIKGLAILIAVTFISGAIHAGAEMLWPTVPANVVSITTKVIPTKPPTTATYIGGV